ncbi:MAG: hypothetical protein LRZ88_05950 [Candidatus Cloacimonetes bacterium]|nr:hypothetical protein [Candidatus Cloacimonadota bacterium]
MHITEAGFEKDLQNVFMTILFRDVLDAFGIFIHHAQDLVAPKIVSRIQERKILVHHFLVGCDVVHEVCCCFSGSSFFFCILDHGALIFSAMRTESCLFRHPFATVKTKLCYDILLQMSGFTLHSASL